MEEMKGKTITLTRVCPDPTVKPQNSLEEEMFQAQKDFEREIDSRDLRQFLDRVQYFQVTRLDLRYDPGRVTTFRVLHEMLRNMTMSEQKLYFDALSDVYALLFTKEITHMVYIHRIDAIFCDLLNVLQFFSLPERSSRCFDFLRKCKEVSNQDLDIIVRKAHSDDMNFILSSFSTNRFPGWNFGKSSDLLMRELAHARYHYNAAVLVKYGFTYSYSEKYFTSNFSKLQSLQFRVNSRCVWAEFRMTSNPVNLRLQMAIEVLIGLFYDRSKSEEEWLFKVFLQKLWRSVPYPFISFCELYKVLWPYIGDHSNLLAICHAYIKVNNIFPVTEFTEPRSLKHCCRVQVRRSLIEANTIGDEAIDSLDIPLKLKSFLKLDC